MLIPSKVIEHFKLEKQLALLDCAFESAASCDVLILTTPNGTKVRLNLRANLTIPERVHKALTYVVTQKRAGTLI